MQACLKYVVFFPIKNIVLILSKLNKLRQRRGYPFVEVLLKKIIYCSRSGSSLFIQIFNINDN